MDHYIPKRRIPVTLWSDHVPGVQGSVFLDLDPAGNRHQPVLEKLTESTRFLPVADNCASSGSVLREAMRSSSRFSSAGAIGL